MLTPQRNEMKVTPLSVQKCSTFKYEKLCLKTLKAKDLLIGNTKSHEYLLKFNY